MKFILILSIFTNSFAHDNAISISAVEFDNEKACQKAGEEAIKIFTSFWRDGKFICAMKEIK